MQGAFYSHEDDAEHNDDTGVLRSKVLTLRKLCEGFAGNKSFHSSHFFYIARSRSCWRNRLDLWLVKTKKLDQLRNVPRTVAEHEGRPRASRRTIFELPGFSER
jgi:hypothetical protein